MPDTTPNGAAPIEGDFINPFDTNLVQEPAKPAAQQPAAPAQEPTKPPPAAEPAKPLPTADQDDIFDEAQYVKNTFGWETPEAGKAELQRLRDLEKTPVKFANADSEKAFNYLKEGKEAELYNFLDRKTKLSKVAELDAKNAISLHLQVTNPHYTTQDIEDILEERYPAPRKPIQEKEEEQADYDIRLSEWNQSVEKINRRINRDSLEAKDNLTKLHSELILPDINRVDPKLVEDATQKELEAKTARERYLTKVDSDYNNATGFKTTFKDKEVEIPLSYDFTAEEKAAYRDKAKSFDLHTYFGPRWFSEDGTPKVDRIMSDLYLLENPDKVMQKFANDAGSKRMEEYLKGKKNISLDGKQQEGTFNPSNQEAIEDALGKWAFAN